LHVLSKTIKIHFACIFYLLLAFNLLSIGIISKTNLSNNVTMKLCWFCERKRGKKEFILEISVKKWRWWWSVLRIRRNFIILWWCSDLSELSRKQQRYRRSFRKFIASSHSYSNAKRHVTCWFSSVHTDQFICIGLNFLGIIDTFSIMRPHTRIKQHIHKFHEQQEECFYQIIINSEEK